MRKPVSAARSAKNAKFVALLQRKCMRAASIGALTAAAESLPGFGKALGLVFGELLDVEMLARVQRELIEETFALYEFKLPSALQEPLIRNVQLVGAGASVASDALTRGMLHRVLGRIGSLVAWRALPATAVVSSAFANATVTYAIGKRAQAVARLRDSPISAMPDAVRAFTGVDERRVFTWSVTAAKDALGAIGRAVTRVTNGTRKRFLREGTKNAKKKTQKRRTGTSARK